MSKEKKPQLWGVGNIRKPWDPRVVWDLRVIVLCDWRKLKVVGVGGMRTPANLI